MFRALATALIVAFIGLIPPALAREISFAGYLWYVRDYPGGPGPNIWNADDVFVDADGLHLFISKTSAGWTSSEVIMLGPPLGFGSYEFEVAGQIDRFDREAVLGLFNYPETDAIGPSGTNEIDIEITPWADPQNPHRLNWTVYPSAPGPEPASYHAPLQLSGPASTHRFIWSADHIAYTVHDGWPETPAYAELDSWVYAPDDAALRIPQVPLVVHINFWLLNGTTELGQPLEVVIRNFHFTAAP